MNLVQTPFPMHDAHRDDAAHNIEAWADIIAEHDKCLSLLKLATETLKHYSGEIGTPEAKWAKICVGDMHLIAESTLQQLKDAGVLS